MSKSIKSNADTLYEGGTEEWFDKIVEKQKQIMIASNLAQNYQQTITERLAEMRKKKCIVCECVGHISSYCWFNTQLFSECRGSAAGIEAWTCYRQGIKLTKTFEKMELMLRIKKVAAMKTNPLLL